MFDWKAKYELEHKIEHQLRTGLELIPQDCKKEAYNELIAEAILLQSLIKLYRDELTVKPVDLCPVTYETETLIKAAEVIE